MKNSKIVIVDYGMGNLRSVQKAFEACGASAQITSKPKDLEKASKIVLPGVGAFAHAMNELKKRKLIEVLKNKVRSGAPYLGICLGLQLLFSESEEGGRVKGLGLISGHVVKFKTKLKIPHMGWNTLQTSKKNCPILEKIKPRDYFYFVHSFFGIPEDRSLILSQTGYGQNFCSALWKGNLFATQFHPEKSQEPGLQIIKNFIRFSPKD